MRTIKASIATIVGLFALACLAASAQAALEFKETGMGFLVGKALGNQVFVVKSSTVTCTALEVEKITGSEAELDPVFQLAAVKYSGCTAKVSLFNFNVKPFSLMYDFQINGEVRIEGETIVEDEGTNCKVRVPEQVLSKVEYVNKTGKIELISKVSKITTSGEGISTCTYASESAGTYNGNSLVELPGFEISA